MRSRRIIGILFSDGTFPSQFWDMSVGAFMDAVNVHPRFCPGVELMGIDLDPEWFAIKVFLAHEELPLVPWGMMVPVLLREEAAMKYPFLFWPNMTDPILYRDFSDVCRALKRVDGGAA